MSLWTLLTDAASGLPTNSVLRQQASLAADKGSLLEREIAQLKSENEVLKIDKGNLEQEIERLKQTIATHDRPHVSDRLLAFICNNPDSTEEDAALALSVKPHIVTHWLNNLRAHDMVEKDTLKPTGDGIWHASDRGLI